MRYFDDMLDKYGFEDGSAEPEGVETYREVYLVAINAIAKQLGSQYRAVAFDRPGMHNHWMITFAPFHSVDVIDKDLYVLRRGSEPTPYPQTDRAMVNAIERAQALDLDSCVVLYAEADWDSVDRLLGENDETEDDREAEDGSDDPTDEGNLEEDSARSGTDTPAEEGHGGDGNCRPNGEGNGDRGRAHSSDTGSVVDGKPDGQPALDTDVPPLP